MSVSHKIFTLLRFYLGGQIKTVKCLTHTQEDETPELVLWHAESTGSATKPHEEFKMRKMTLHFCGRNAKFYNSYQLFTDDNICSP